MQKPFLKWAGGKVKLAERIKEMLPPGKRLIEPFVGAGSIFLNTEYDSYVLSDVNSDLTTLYEKLSEPGFIEYVKTFFTGEFNSQAEYTRLRTEFNTTTDKTYKSALFIYLNRHCFNGLCRYNKSGGFNVPYGKYESPYFPENELKNFKEKSTAVVFKNQDFRVTMNEAQPGDVVYCDPPYVPVSETANFTSYAAGGFSMKDQLELRDLAIQLSEKGIPVVISNHSTAWTTEHYSTAMITEFDVQRNISAKGDSRNKAKELLALFQ